MDISSTNRTNPYASATQGMQTGIANLNKHANDIANPNSTTTLDSLIAVKQDENLITTSAKALKVADGMIGTVIDIMA